MQHSDAAKPDYGGYAVGSLSPRLKMAIRALVSGMCKTQNEAAEIAQVTPAYLSQVKHSPLGQAYMAELEANVDDKTISTTKLLAVLGREATLRMAQLMRFSDNENIVLKASQDLMDRAPETSKVQKLQVESFTLNSKDARGIADALVAAASLKERFVEAATGDFIRVDDSKAITPVVEQSVKEISSGK